MTGVAEVVVNTIQHVKIHKETTLDDDIASDLLKTELEERKSLITDSILISKGYKFWACIQSM